MRIIIITSIVIFVLIGCRDQKAMTNSNEKRPGQGQRGAPPSIDEIFNMDTNGDGKLAKSEIQGPLLREFSKIDSDNDGFITRKELENAPKPPRGQRPPKNNK